MPLEGLQLGKYRLVRLIGSGGMGDVYIGEDVRLSRQLAIKVMRAEVSPYPGGDAVKEAARLFQREMKAIARLDHPSILPLYDYGEELLHQTTLTYMVMPFRSEGSLADWLRQRNTTEPLPLQVITSLLSQAAEALQYAHDHQIIHQDVKLSNFLIRMKKDVSSPPDLQLADFGIAKMSSATSSVSHASRGTPVYMAPEQWNGDPVPATDQYALAIMTYELLTGRPPFRGRPEQMMYQHLTVAPLPPGAFRKDLPASIDAVLLHALAKKPQERFPSISAFAVAFQQAMRSTGDLYATLAISEGEAATGAKRELTLPGGRKAQVSIPQGVHDKQVLRLEGLGEPYYAGGPFGALVLTLAIASQDKTALAKEAVYDETIASSGSPNAISKAVLTNSSSHGEGTTETIDEPSPPTSEVSAVNVDPQLAQQSKPGILAGERQATPKRPDEKVNIWKIGKQQVVAMIVGTVLYGILSHFYIYAPGGGFFVAVFATIIIPLFFGAIFGPWVGIVTGGVGFLVANLIPPIYISFFYTLRFTSPDIWYWTLNTALIGFVAGLTLLMKQGQQYTWRTIILADSICAVAVFAGLSLSIILSFHIFNYIFYVALPTAISGFILLFISLIIYNAIVKRRKRTSTIV